MPYANGLDRDARSQAGRAPKRITITIPFSAFRLLEERSNAEGRSLSNLAAYLIERGLRQSEER